MTPAGRPPRSNLPARRTITFRVTEEERAELEKAAQPYSISEWLRDLAFAAARTDDVSPQAMQDANSMTDYMIAQMGAESKITPENKAKMEPVVMELAVKIQGMIDSHEKTVSAMQTMIDYQQAVIDSLRSGLATK